MSTSTQTHVSIQTKTITGSDGKTKKITIREERKIVNGKEQITRTEETEEFPDNVSAKPISNAATPSQTIEEFRQDCLKAQNAYRAKHGISPLKMSDSLNKLAQEWAEHLAAIGRLEHRPKNAYGENCFCAMNSRGDVNGSEVADSWYSEIKDYKFGDDFSPSTGHFTQVVWKASAELGCGKAKGANNYVYVVANYSPAGNVMGHFRDNVFPLK